MLRSWLRGLPAVVVLVAACSAPPPPSATTRDTAGLAYVPTPAERQHLALTWPAEAGFATVLFVHGGSLTTGDPDEARYRALCGVLAREGFGCARVGYRLAGTAKWPAQPKDLARAVAWTRHHIGEFGGDSTRIFLLGHSSGCLLSTLLAADARYLAAVDLTPRDLAGVLAMGCVTTPFDTAGRGLTLAQLRAGFAGSHDDQLVYTRVEDLLAANPSDYVGPHLPPIRFLIAEGERYQPPILEQNARFVRRAREAGVDADLVILPGREHETAVDSLANPADPTWSPILEFLRQRTGGGADSSNRR